MAPLLPPPMSTLGNMRTAIQLKCIQQFVPLYKMCMVCCVFIELDTRLGDTQLEIVGKYVMS